MKTISFGEYKNIQRMSFNDLNRYILRIAKIGYDQCMNDITGGEPCEVYCLDESEVRDKLKTFPISDGLIEKIITALET